MITSLEVYLLAVLGDIKGASEIIIALLFVVGVIVMMGIKLGEFFDLDDEEDAKGFRFYLKLWSLFFTISLLGCIFCPSFEESAAIYLIPQIANNKQINQLPPNIIGYLNKI